MDRQRAECHAAEHRERRVAALARDRHGQIGDDHQRKQVDQL